MSLVHMGCFIWGRRFCLGCPLGQPRQSLPLSKKQAKPAFWRGGDMARPKAGPALGRAAAGAGGGSLRGPKGRVAGAVRPRPKAGAACLTSRPLPRCLPCQPFFEKRADTAGAVP